MLLSVSTWTHFWQVSFICQCLRLPSHETQDLRCREIPTKALHGKHHQQQIALAICTHSTRPDLVSRIALKCADTDFIMLRKGKRFFLCVERHNIFAVAALLSVPEHLLLCDSNISKSCEYRWFSVGVKVQKEILAMRYDIRKIRSVLSLRPDCFVRFVPRITDHVEWQCHDTPAPGCCATESTEEGK